ncbi:MAG: hypothetical protein KJ792_06235 [Actinobacteria bacterium]|nr:hypothetical protein [Actinomycetota bacterium]MCG2801776.1 hypothetical protein [Cellulomonas sp.]
MGELPVWWTSLWVGVLVVALVLWVLGALRSRHRRQAEPMSVPAPHEPEPVRTTWWPVIEPMGPVSGWPYTLESPDAPPTRSPEDRPDLWATLS